MYGGKRVTVLKARALRMGCPVYFMLEENSYGKSNRIQRLKQKEQLQYDVRFVHPSYTLTLGVSSSPCIKGVSSHSFLFDKEDWGQGVKVNRVRLH